MNSLEQFNKFYSQNSEKYYESSLLDFYKTVVSTRLKPNLRVLDLGPGSKSIFEDLELDQSKITSIDFSQKAVELASKNSSIDYRIGDISKKADYPNENFDLVFDSHCFHCITNSEDRKNAFMNIYERLNDGGLFASEMMVQKNRIPANMPYKHVQDAFDLEKEILDYGFKIEYFLIGSGLSFSNAHGECDVLRVVCRK